MSFRCDARRLLALSAPGRSDARNRRLNLAGASSSPRRKRRSPTGGQRRASSTHLANLPVPLTSFIGRAAELARLQDILGRQGSRCITLIGSIGCGKSRLALQAVAGLDDTFPDGRVWVDLGDADPGAAATDRIAAALRAVKGIRAAHPDELLLALQDATLLLILDNCDQVTGDIAVWVDQVLRRCPDVHVLATSREPLHLLGETVWPVPLMAVPPLDQVAAGAGVEVAQWLQYEAVRLFVERAAAVAPGFALTERNGPAIARICQRLEGNPLAIERAAARVRVLTPEEIVIWLTDTLRVLDEPAVSGPAQGRSLWGALEDSYRRLSPLEQALFRGLSVFRGGATFEAVRAVAATSAPQVDVLNRLTRLADKSLILVEHNGGQARYCLLALAQEYGDEQARLAGESAALRQAHARFYLGLVERARGHIRVGQATEWLDRLALEHANLEAALRYGLADDPALALRLAGSLWRYWEARGHVAGGRAWLEAVLAQTPDAPSLDRAQALEGAAVLAHNQSDYVRARVLQEAARDMRRDLGDSHGLAYSLYSLAILAKDRGDYEEAARLFDESLALFQAVKDRAGRAYALLHYGILKHVHGDYRASTTLFEASLVEMRQLADNAGLALALSNLGLAARNQGRYVEAREFHTEALALRRALGDTLGQALSLTNLGFLAYDQADLPGADSYLQPALDLFRSVGNQWGAALCLVGLGQSAAYQGRHARAVQLCGEAWALYRDVNHQLGMATALYAQSLVYVQVGDYQSALETCQRSLTLRQAIQDRHGMAECLDVLAVVAAATGLSGAAARLDGASDALRKAINAPRSPLEQGQLNRAIAPALAADAAQYERRRAAGAEMPLDTVIAYALRPSLQDVDTAGGSAPPTPLPQQARWLGQDAPPYEVRIFALDGAQVYRQDRLLVPADWKYAKPRELLYYLLSYPSRTKEQIGIALWPDASAAQLRSALHSAMHRLRRALGHHDWVVVTDEVYTFNRDFAYWYDVEVFETHLSEAARLRNDGGPQAADHLQAAVKLYRSDFLEGVVETTDWVFLKREALREKLMEALLTLGQLLFAQRRYEQAAEVYRQAIHADNYLEVAHRELMRCYVRLGERSRAIRHYQYLVNILDQELHVAPAPETRELYEQLMAGYGI